MHYFLISNGTFVILIVKSDKNSWHLTLSRSRWSYHKTNDWVRRKINFLVAPQEPLPATIKRRKLVWFGHVTCHGSLSETILQATLEGGRRHGRQGKCWMDDIKEWTSLFMPDLLTRASCTRDRMRISAESSLMPPPTTQSVKGLNRTGLVICCCHCCCVLGFVISLLV